MYIATGPNRSSPPAILPRESYRVDGKVKTRTLADLSHWEPARIEAVQRTLRGNFENLDNRVSRWFPLYAQNRMSARIGSC